MSVILGVDVGGSTTKIVAFDHKLIGMLQVRAGDQLTSLYGAIGNLLHQHHLKLSDVQKIVLTGVGASLIDEDIYGIPTCKVNEFKAIGKGGLLLAGQSDGLVVSMGTGTAFVYARGNEIEHIGGSGVGGGTLIGLSQELLGESDYEAIIALANTGDLSHVDLSVQDISKATISTLPDNVTASNFGRIKSTATKGDLALGLINMIFQTAGVMAAFTAKARGFRQVIVTGSLTTIPQAKEYLDGVAKLHGIPFILPEDATFATALGAAALQQ
ncbi:MAG: type II pantothenate kinase [Clostridia bacterium]|nr:type II pantothenate kinase [Clostridia bacterium]